MQIESKKTIESTTTPGVTFTVRRLNRIQRAKRDLAVCGPRREYAPQIDRFTELATLKADKPLSDDQSKEYTQLDYELGLFVDAYLKPNSIGASLIEVTGVIGEATVTKANLFGLGAESDALLQEIYVACEAAAGLSGEQQKNLQSPSTSSAQTDGDKENSSAAIAE